MLIFKVLNHELGIVFRVFSLFLKFF